MRKLMTWPACVFLSLSTLAQPQRIAGETPLGIVTGKNLPFLSMLGRDTAVRRFLAGDSVLQRLQRSHRQRLVGIAADSSSTESDMLAALKLDSATLDALADRLNELHSHPGLRRLVKTTLIPSGSYRVKLGMTPPEAAMGVAFRQDLSSIHHTVDVYAGGKRPNYPLIDSNSLGIPSSGRFPRGYRDRLRQIVDLLVRTTAGDSRFMALPISAAETFLALNGRLQAADFEPMESGVNARAARRADTLRWARYPYSVLLVPGAGPSSYDVTISVEAMIRLGLAVDAYRRGLAPFILVSGGKVHPYLTKTCEALEMKRHLMEVYGVPEHAIIIDPHARHTTTNMRNAARLMIKYGFPLQKPALVCSTKGQSRWVSTTLPQRCQIELGYVPYRYGRRLDDYLTEFYATPDALQVDFDEPIDP